MTKYKLVPVEPTPEMLEAGADWCGQGLGTDEAKGRAVTAYKAMLAAAPAVQGEPVYLYRRRGLDDFVTCDFTRYTELSGNTNLFETKILYTTPQPAEQQTAPDVTALVEALETALFGTPLDDVPNRDNDDIWRMCYQHLPERASDALRDHLARIETALAAHRKQVGEA